MFETLAKQKETQGALEQKLADAQHTWPTFEHPAPLSNEQLQMLNAKARELGRPLTAEETTFLLGDKLPKPRVSAVRFLEV